MVARIAKFRRDRLSLMAVIAAFALATAFIVTMLVTAGVALADEYSIGRVDIDATVRNDGSVVVSEVREFSFDGDFHGVYWKIPKGEYEGASISPEVSKVGEIGSGGSFREFKQVQEGDADYGQNGTYLVTDEGSYVKVKIYSAHSDDTADFAITYTDQNLARRYADTSELYWKFVSDGWDVESENVTCTVHLPVPDGEEAKAGKNVRAWGHGPLDASLRFKGNDIIYTVPGVGGDEFAEARIVFPAAWLANATASNKKVLNTVLDEERKWADEANERRTQARVVSYAALGIGVLVALLAGAVSVSKLSSYKRRHTPQFDDKYFRDVPTDDHPAVLGALLNDGEPTDDDMSAALVRLTDIGALKLEKVAVESRGVFGRKKSEDDYALTRAGNTRDVAASKSAIAIDRSTLKFFDKVLSKCKGRENGTLYFSDFEKVAKDKPEAYNDAYENWKTDVKAQAEQRGFFVDKNSNGQGLVVGAMALDILVAAALLFMTIAEVLPVGWGLGVVLLLAVSAVLGFVILRRMDNLSEEAVEVIAKLKALKRWLKDFTRLEEAVPQDVILWNRLLVMAVSLGVAEEVIEQLKVAAPQVLEDPVVAPVYGWYMYPHTALGSPASRLGSSVTSSHKVSSAALAASSMSSGGGGGGGFSGGGGGGFGGGGGGGAF